MTQPINAMATAPTDWVRQQYLKATQFLADMGIVTDNVALEESRYLPDTLSIWKLNSLDKSSYWVLSCDQVVDALPASVAAEAKAAALNFSMRWQMKAAQLQDVATDDSAKQQAIAMADFAEFVYSLCQQEKLWG